MSLDNPEASLQAAQATDITAASGVKEIPQEIRERLSSASYRLKNLTRSVDLEVEARKMANGDILTEREIGGASVRSRLYYVPSQDHPSNFSMGYRILEVKRGPDFHRGRGEVSLGYDLTLYNSEGRPVSYAECGDAGEKSRTVAIGYYPNGVKRKEEAHDYSNSQHFIEVEEFDQRGRQTTSTRTDDKKKILLRRSTTAYTEDGGKTTAREHNNENDGKPISKAKDVHNPNRTHVDSVQFFDNGRAVREEVRRYEDPASVNKVSGGSITYFDEDGKVSKTEEILPSQN